MSNIITFENVGKKYVDVNIESSVFENVNLEIKAGEFIALYGRSGSGKSTLLHLMGLIEQPTTGRITLEGKTVSELNETDYARIRNKKIGFVFQDFKLIDDMTILENVEIPLAFSSVKMSFKERRNKCLSILEEVGLKNKEAAYPNQLSGGQKQRVAIARALINDPVLLLADEPTGNLDEESSKSVMELIKRMYEKGNMTVVIATHDPNNKEYANKQIQMEVLTSL